MPTFCLMFFRSDFTQGLKGGPWILWQNRGSGCSRLLLTSEGWKKNPHDSFKHRYDWFLLRSCKDKVLTGLSVLRRTLSFHIRVNRNQSHFVLSVRGQLSQDGVSGHPRNCGLRETGHTNQRLINKTLQLHTL